MRRRIPVSSVVLGLLLAVSAATADGDKPSAQAIWYGIRTERGTAIGYAYHDVTARGDGGRDITDHQEIRIVEPTIKIAMHPDTSVHLTRQMRHTVVHQDANGATTAIDSESRNGHDETHDHAAIGNGMATITHHGEADTRTLTVPLPADVRFDGGDALLASWDGKSTVTFDSFDIDALHVDRVVITPLPSTQPAGGREALRRRYDGDLLVAQTHLVIDGTGDIVEIRQPMLGANLITRHETRDAALDYEAYRIFPNIMRKSPYRIQKDALHGHIRYRFGFKDNASFTVPETGEQRVTATADGLQVDICAACGHGVSGGDSLLAEAVKPTLWLQSDNPKLTAIAAAVANLSAAQKMVALRDKAHDLLPRTNFTGHYSALDALEHGSGDCTEEAALLAALGRAAGVPTLVVNGLVYSRESYHGISNTFMPHSWVLAYVDGSWQSYDSALGDFDSTHIALTVSDGDERSIAAAGLLAGLLDWQSMAEVRSRPAP